MRKNRHVSSFLFTIMIGVMSLLASLASAESYLGGQLGFTIPEDFSSVFAAGGGARINNFDMNNSFTYGVKAGHYFDRYNWLGVEADFYTTTPHINGQVAQFTPGGPIPVPGALTRVSTMAFSLMGRYPGEKFQPYAGMGLGLNFAKATGAFAKDTDTSPGFHLVGGARLFLTKEVALFGEYKYDRATFRFADNGLTGDYMGHTFVTGITFHFLPPGR
jgi:opacity protein-like surface antigen